MLLTQTRWLKIPFLLGIVPLMIGTPVFLLWAMTEWAWLALAGVLLYFTGYLSVVLGLAYLGIGILKTTWVRGWSPALFGTAVCVGAALVINFPVADTLVSAAIEIATIYKVVVHNHSSIPLQQAALNGGGVAFQLGQIDAGASITKKFHITSDGTLIFSAEQSGKKLKVTVQDYVTVSMGGYHQIDVSAGGMTSVHD